MKYINYKYLHIYIYLKIKVKLFWYKFSQGRIYKKKKSRRDVCVISMK